MMKEQEVDLMSGMTMSIIQAENIIVGIIDVELIRATVENVLIIEAELHKVGIILSIVTKEHLSIISKKSVAIVAIWCIIIQITVQPRLQFVKTVGVTVIMQPAVLPLGDLEGSLVEMREPKLVSMTKQQEFESVW